MFYVIIGNDMLKDIKDSKGGCTMDYDILSNKARCKKCGEIVESKRRQNLVRCKCGSMAVDGGRDYLKRIGDQENIEELSVFKEEPQNKGVAMCKKDRYCKVEKSVEDKMITEVRQSFFMQKIKNRNGVIKNV